MQMPGSPQVRVAVIDALVLDALVMTHIMNHLNFFHALVSTLYLYQYSQQSHLKCKCLVRLNQVRVAELMLNGAYIYQ